MKAQLQIESVLKEMILVEDRAKDILSQGDKKAAEIVSNAQLKAQSIIDESIHKARKEESEIFEKARIDAEKKKETEISSLIKTNKAILSEAEKRKEKVIEHIMKWLKNEI